MKLLIANVLWVIAIITIVCLSSSCSTTRAYKQLSTQIGDYGLDRYDDKEKGVSCYWASDKDNIALSCVKTGKDK